MKVRDYNRQFLPKLTTTISFINGLDCILLRILEENIENKEDREELLNRVLRTYGWDEYSKQIILDALELYKIEEGIKKLDINKTKEWRYSPEKDIAICSVCGYEHYLGTENKYSTNFCPNCGTKMEK